MTTDDDPIDDLVPAAPCPTCRRTPEVTADQFGRVVRCWGCGTRFRAAPAPPPTEGEPVADAAPSAAPPRTGRRHAADENPYDDGYGRFEEVHTPGRTVALATLHFVYVGLLSVCGVLSSVFARVYPKALPGPDITPAARTFLHVIHALMVLAAVPLLIAGLQVLRKRPAARAWSVAGLAAAGVLLLVNLVQVALTLPVFTGTPGETSGVMCGMAFQLLFWLGYLIPVGVLLVPATPQSGGKSGPEQ